MTRADQKKRMTAKSADLVVIGGGVIGSQAAPLAARLPGVSHIRLIDGDYYTKSNLVSQAIAPSDVGQAKVEVLARLIRRQSPHVTVEPIVDWVENVPKSMLRSDAVLCCLDSRRARCYVNEACWRLGVPFLDAGVDGPAALARANVYHPGAGRACMECGWNDADYKALEQVYACQNGTGGPAATHASASLGAIAAGLLVSECQELLAGALDPECCRQVLWDTRHHRCLATTYGVNPDCRFDHAQWITEPLPINLRRTTFDRFLKRLQERNAKPLVAIQLAGQHFVSRLVCGECRNERDKCLYLDRALTESRRRCSECDRQMSVSGFHSAEWLHYPANLPVKHSRRTLSSIGFREGDIVTLQQAGGRRYVELVAEHEAAGSASLSVCKGVQPSSHSQNGNTAEREPAKDAAP